MGTPLAISRVYGLPRRGYQFYKGKSRKFYEFVRSVSKRVGNENNAPDKRKIIKIVAKSKMTLTEIKASTVQNTMKIFMANKKYGFGTTLREIKAMTPDEIFCFTEEIKKTAENLNNSKD